MNDIIQDWLSDIPEQFIGKEKIKILLDAFGKQLQEINDVFETMEELTGIDNAEGVNLDYMGTIIPLTRKDATVILRKARKVELTDEFYRNALRYQNLKNTCACTYEDIMDSINVLWGTSKIHYREDIEYPATIFIDIDEVSIDKEDPAKKRVLAIKPAGVALIYTYAMLFKDKITSIEKFITSIDLKTSIIEALLRPSNYLDGTYSMNGEIIMDSAEPIVPVVYSFNLTLEAKNTETIKAYCFYDGEWEEL